MRTRTLESRALRLRALIGLFVVCSLSLTVSFATVPFPSCVFYGEARDEFGWPYVGNADVILRVDGRECSRWSIMGVLAPGVAGPWSASWGSLRLLHAAGDHLGHVGRGVSRA
jgi:hypothetical protein